MKPGDRALVTGAAGFIGSRLARRLADAGVQVRALDVKPPPAFAVDGHPLVEFTSVDIQDTRAVTKVLEGVDVVFHLASVHLDVHASERSFWDVNVDAVESLVRSSAASGIRRFVHTSSVGIFGHVRTPPAGEDTPKQPATTYEKTKLAGETRALEAAHRYGVDLVVLRPAWVYGPGCPRTRKLLDAIRSGRFFFVGTGSNLRHPVHVDDTVDGFILAASSQASVAGQTCILAGPRYMTLREMVEIAARTLGVRPPRIRIPGPLFRVMAAGAETTFRILGKPPPISRRTLTFFQNDNAFDTRAAQDLLGFRPRFDFEDGIRQTLQECSDT